MELPTIERYVCLLFMPDAITIFLADFLIRTAHYQLCCDRSFYQKTI